MIWLDCRKLGMKGKELHNFFVHRAGIGMNEGSTFGPGGEGFHENEPWNNTPDSH